MKNNITDIEESLLLKEFLILGSSNILNISVKPTPGKNNAINKLDALSPLKTLDRGYSIIKHNDKAIASVKDLKSNDKIEIELKDGSVNATVI